VTIDGTSTELVDLWAGSNAYQQVAYTKSGLTDGLHTLKVEWTGIKGGPGGTGGDYVNIDAIDVIGALVAPPTRYQQSDPRIVYGGSTWSTATAASLYSGGSLRYGKGAGKSFTAYFTGTALQWIALKAPSYGEARVTLDNGTPETVNLWAGSNAYQQVAYTKSGLPDGLHTLKVEWTGVKGGPGATGGDYVNIDAIDVIGELVAPPTRFEQNDARISYTGSGWSTATATGLYSGNSMRYGKGVGRSVATTFTGTAVRWVALKSPAYGVARVILDGGTPELVNLYSATNSYQQVVYSRSGLGAGTHTLRIEWTGTKGGPPTSGDYINVDAIEVVGTLSGP
jgi:hypothetical protein